MSNFPKFKYGDSVLSRVGNKGTVKSIQKKDGKFKVTVLFSSGTSLDYSEDDLSFDSEFIKEKKEVHVGTICPVCQTKYKITRFGAKSWKDCLKCGKTAEQLCEEAQKKDEYSSTTYKSISGWDDDSWF